MRREKKSNTFRIRQDMLDGLRVKTHFKLEFSAQAIRLRWCAVHNTGFAL